MLTLACEFFGLSVSLVTKWPERWLAVQLRQDGKNRVRSYLLRHDSYGKTAAVTATAQHIFSHSVCNVILTALTEFLRNSPNGNGETATAERRQDGNQASLCTYLYGKNVSSNSVLVHKNNGSYGTEEGQRYNRTSQVHNGTTEWRWNLKHLKTFKKLKKNLKT